jgi:archaemetzincin
MKSARILLFVFLLVSCGQRDELAANAAVRSLDQRATELIKTKDSLKRFSKPMVVQPGDWLESHPEDGETFEQYIQSGPTLPTTERGTIYIQAIGEFSAEQMKIIRLTADYMRAFYGLPVVLRDRRPLGRVPEGMSRIRYPNNRQIRTSYFIDDLLPKLLPTDAAALICLTSYDLYPEETWNFVFGQANLVRRVGVWSLWRLDDDNGKRATKELFLSRTLKVAMHETGHMFSLRHCTKYECLMSGTNHLDETDRRPLDTCPECTAKIAWAMNYPLAKRYKNLGEFWRRLGNKDEQKSIAERETAVSASNK